MEEDGEERRRGDRESITRRGLDKGCALHNRKSSAWLIRSTSCLIRIGHSERRPARVGRVQLVCSVDSNKVLINK